LSAARVESPLPAYLVRGSDAALRAAAVRSLVDQLVGDDDPALVVEWHEPDGDPPDTRAAVEAAGTPSFLGNRRVVLLRDVGAYPLEGLQPLLEYLGDPLPSSSVVLVAGEGRLHPKLVEAVKGVGHVVDADVPGNKKGRTSWLARRLEDAPVRLTPPAVGLVDEHLGEDLGRLHNLLEALAAAYGQGARLEPDDVSPFLGEAGAAPPWELTDAIDRADTSGAVAALHRMLGAGDRHPLVVMATLHGHFGRMLRLDGADGLDEAGAARLLGLKGSTFPARKALDGARSLGSAGIAEAFRLLAGADLDLRGATAWPERLVLEVLVARLSRLRRAGGRSRARPSARAGGRRSSGERGS
jgi:DNA polymerase-3 subunit delta